MPPVLGLAKGKVALAECSTVWLGLFDEERERLQASLASLIVGIEHFGSTSIPGIKAKPILDIMLGLPNFAAGLQLVAPMQALG